MLGRLAYLRTVRATVAALSIVAVAACTYGDQKLETRSSIYPSPATTAAGTTTMPLASSRVRESSNVSIVGTSPPPATALAPQIERHLEGTQRALRSSLVTHGYYDRRRGYLKPGDTSRDIAGRRASAADRIAGRRPEASPIERRRASDARVLQDRERHIEADLERFRYQRRSGLAPLAGSSPLQIQLGRARHR